jgi:hypothetical protein
MLSEKAIRPIGFEVNPGYKKIPRKAGKPSGGLRVTVIASIRVRFMICTVV